MNATRPLLVVIALSGAAAFAACTLQPQPLPPSELASGEDGKSDSPGGDFGAPSPPNAVSDAAAASSDGGPSHEPDDAGDAGETDGGDAGGDDAGDAG